MSLLKCYLCAFVIMFAHAACPQKRLLKLNNTKSDLIFMVNGIEDKDPLAGSGAIYKSNGDSLIMILGDRTNSLQFDVKEVCLTISGVKSVVIMPFMGIQSNLKDREGIEQKDIDNSEDNTLMCFEKKGPMSKLAIYLSVEEDKEDKEVTIQGLSVNACRYKEHVAERTLYK